MAVSSPMPQRTPPRATAVALPAAAPPSAAARMAAINEDRPFTVDSLAAAIAGLAGLVGGVALRWAPDDVRQLIVPIALAVVLLIWLVGPITVAGSDASMDPVKLVVLPLSRRQLVIGLTLSALIGPGGLATVPAVVGLVIGTAPLGPGALAAQMGFSFRSCGENLAVAIAETAPGRSVVKLMSASIVPTTMIDWGKSNQNVKRFEEALRRLAGTPLLPPA